MHEADKQSDACIGRAEKSTVLIMILNCIDNGIKVYI